MAEIKYYDIGLNLFCPQFKHPDLILKRAMEQGVACILTGSDPGENRKIDEYLRADHGMEVYGTAGLHPHNADDFTEDILREAESIYKDNPKVVAVGECGLDYNRMFSEKKAQLHALERFVELADSLSAPMFLHERDAADDFAALFAAAPDVAGRSVVHCFTGDRKTAERYLDMGFSIGVTGWIGDDRRAGELREAVKAIPKDRILVETDAPYLTPRNIKGLGHTNVPENIVYVVRTLAEYMGMDEEELIVSARENTIRLFGLN